MIPKKSKDEKPKDMGRKSVDIPKIIKVSLCVITIAVSITQR